MRHLLRALGASALAVTLAAGASADTIYMKNGSVIRGTVVGFENGEFAVILDGAARSRATLAESDIERIEFESNGGTVDSSSPVPEQPRRSGSSRSVATARPDDASTAPVSDPSSPPQYSGGATQQGDVSVKPEADWTNSNFRVRRGDVVRITARGSVKLDATGRRTAGPDGINLPDRNKLMPTRPTGGLIAVIGDDNDEFIYVGAQAQFVATRDGYLFLSLNEGNLRDNTGQMTAHVEIGGSSASTASPTVGSTRPSPQQSAPQSAPRSAPPVASRRSGSSVGSSRPSSPPATSRRATRNAPPASYPDTSSNSPSNAGDSGAYDSGGDAGSSPAPSTPPATSRRSAPVPSAPAATTSPAGTIPAGTVVRESSVTIQPKLDWTNTKLRVDRGQIVRITASGRVQLDSGGQRAVSPAGTNSQDADKLIPSAPTGALIAVIGDDNDEFIPIGDGAEWVAQRSGVLFLSVNEGNLRDNSGSFEARIRIEQPRVAAPGATTGAPAGQPAQQTGSVPSPAAGSSGGAVQAPTPRPAVPQIGPSGGQADIVIPAKGDWTSTQIAVKKGMRIRITASGTIKLDAAGAPVTPAGIAKADPHKLIADKPTGGLVAVVGDDNNDYIFIGTQAEFVAQRDGMLFIGINEGELADNSGSFTVHIVVTAAGRR